MTETGSEGSPAARGPCEICGRDRHPEDIDFWEAARRKDMCGRRPDGLVDSRDCYRLGYERLSSRLLEMEVGLLAHSAPSVPVTAIHDWLAFVRHGARSGNAPKGALKGSESVPRERAEGPPDLTDWKARAEQAEAAAAHEGGKTLALLARAEKAERERDEHDAAYWSQCKVTTHVYELLDGERAKRDAAESALAEARRKALEEAAQIAEARWYPDWDGLAPAPIIAQRIRALASGSAPATQETQVAAAPRSPQTVEDLAQLIVELVDAAKSDTMLDRVRRALAAAYERGITAGSSGERPAGPPDPAAPDLRGLLREARALFRVNGRSIHYDWVKWKSVEADTDFLLELLARVDAALDQKQVGAAPHSPEET